MAENEEQRVTVRPVRSLRGFRDLREEMDRL